MRRWGIIEQCAEAEAAKVKGGPASEAPAATGGKPRAQKRPAAGNAAIGGRSTRRRGNPPLRLGSARAAYAQTMSTEWLEKAVKGAREAETAWRRVVSAADLLECSAKAEEACQAVADATGGGAFPKEPGSYMRRHVLRKIVLAKLSAQTATQGESDGRRPCLQVDWQDVTRFELISLCADEREHLAAFPENWTARDISEFIFHRGDLPLLVSMWGCLWGGAFHEASRSAGEDGDEESTEKAFVRFVRTGSYQKTAERLHSSYGVWCCPALVKAEAP